MQDTNFKSTKFVLAILLVLIGAGLMFIGSINFDQFKELIMPVVGFYFAANVLGKAANAFADNQARKTLE